MNFLKKMGNVIEEPRYLQQNIQYVTDKRNSEVCISSRHTWDDYLVIGIIALQRSIEGKSGDILVYNENIENYQPHAIREMEVRIYMQIFSPLDFIYDLYMEKKKRYGISTIIFSNLMTDFNEIPKSVMDELKFENFNDLTIAQKNAFLLIKYFIRSAKC